MISDELFKLAEKLDPYIEFEFKELDALVDMANEISKSWSGSWLGYQSRVYYKDLTPPPVGAVFSKEWGLKEMYSGLGSRGEWIEYEFDKVVSEVNRRAKKPSFNEILSEGEKAKEVFDEIKTVVLSLIHSNTQATEDKFSQGVIDKIESEKVYDESDFVGSQRPQGEFISRDALAVDGGIRTPPHIAILCKVAAARNPFQSCSDLQKQVRILASHMQNVEKRKIQSDRVGTNVFIGHGRSPDWRVLKDFVGERIGLPWDEFNRVPVAGVTNITRLAQMLDQAAIAFLVMTAEDEQADGNHRARMNVIHEVGLFQGRLGFEKAIVLLEDGCEEFSNIQGLGQIRFPKGNISAIFEDVRQVLEREGLVA